MMTRRQCCQPRFKYYQYVRCFVAICGYYCHERLATIVKDAWLLWSLKIGCYDREGFVTMDANAWLMYL